MSPRGGLRTCNRRDFLVRTGGPVLTVLVAGCGGLASVRTTPSPDGRVRLALAEHPGLTRPGGSAVLAVEGLRAPVHALRRDDGSYSALSAVCTHQGCLVEVEGERLVCPCHGSTYGRDGRVLVGPAPLPLRRFPVRVLHGILEIDLRGAS